MLRRLFFFYSFLSVITFAQNYDISGDWKSSSGNAFRAQMSSEGFMYMNLQTEDVIKASRTGFNQYQAYFYTDGELKNTITYTVLSPTYIMLTQTAGPILYWQKQAGNSSGGGGYSQPGTRQNSGGFSCEYIATQIKILESKRADSQRSLDYQQSVNSTSISHTMLIQSIQRLINTYNEQIQNWKNRAINAGCY